KVFAISHSEVFAEFRKARGVFKVTFDLFPQRLQHTRHCNQHRNALATDAMDDVAGLERVLKENGAAQQRRKINAQELAEDVTEREEIQKTQRMHKSFVPRIGGDLLLERRDVGQHVAMRNDYSLGLRRGAGGKNDF